MEVVLTLLFVTEVLNHIHPVEGNSEANHLFPHAVLLKFLENGYFYHQCGSSILNQRILLTSAFCLYRPDDDKWDIEALVGYDDIKKKPIVGIINNYLIHEDYNSEKYSNNIGLVHLSKPLILGPTVKRVIIESTFGKTVDVLVAGLELANDNGGKYPNTLKFLKQTIQDVRVCKKAYDKLPQASTLGVFCALGEMENNGNRGYSGTALMASDSVQVGITSFRSKLHPQLIVYTNVTYYYKWIRDNAKLLYCTGKPFMYIFSDNTI